MKRVAFFGLFLFLILLIFFSSPASDRITLVVASDPVEVVSWHPQSRSLTTIRIPAETRIETVGGYGVYPIRGFWLLGNIDEAARAAFVPSMQEALGLPVSFYVGPGEGESLAPFSWQMLLPWGGGALQHNVPLPAALRLLRHLPFISSDHKTDVTLAPGRGLASVTAPDGSDSLTLDTNQSDVLLGPLFEEEDIRREAIPVAVYNTTTVPSLGTRVGRLLSHIGYHVVAVENDEPIIQRCEVHAGQEYAKTRSVRVVRRLFGCALVEDESQKRADIVVRMGSEYAQRFLPGVR